VQIKGVDADSGEDQRAPPPSARAERPPTDTVYEAPSLDDALARQRAAAAVSRRMS